LGFRVRFSGFGFRIKITAMVLFPSILKPGLKLRVLHKKVHVRLPGKGNSNSHDARMVHLIISILK
jgi:hypothetical protein